MESERIMITYEYHRTDGSVKSVKVIDPKTKWNYEIVKECTMDDLMVGSDVEKILAAQLGYGLDRLVCDDSPYVRVAVAKKGYRLDILCNDIVPFVKEVAESMVGKSCDASKEMLDKIISVEGYKAFRGVMQITPKNKAFQPYLLGGYWLYKADTGCWYCKGCSFTPDVCKVVSVD